MRIISDSYVGGFMHEFDYWKYEKREKEFVQEQLQLELPLPVRQQAEEKKDDRRKDRGAVIIDIWK